jgi:ssDNA-binding Zn-finger/Zn-ribbon topoisomerase 1
MSRFQPATVVPGSRRPWTAFHAKDACPTCGGPMQIRVNAKKRTTFAGCKAYPACNGTIAWNALKKTT